MIEKLVVLLARLPEDKQLQMLKALEFALGLCK